MRRHLLLPGLVVLAFVALPGGARAEDSTARALAEDGLKAVREGQDDVGCPKLIEAWHLDPTLLGAGFAVAGCHERKGRLATAWATYASVAGKAEARHDARAAEAREHADALRPRLSTLTIIAPPDVAALPGLVVQRGEIQVGGASLGVAVPVDGGSYEIRVTATDRRAWTSVVEVPAEGGTIEVTLIAPPVVEPKPLGVPPADPPPARPPPVTTGLGGLDVGAILAGVGGAALMGVGIGLGVKANDDYDSVSSGCHGNVCDPASAATRRDALGLADAGTGTFVAGAVLGATSIVLGVISATTRPSKGIALTPRGFRF